jgi:PBP1b-binding outer membrane lipoprotein LpoB
MQKVALFVGLAFVIAGCSSESAPKNNPETPKPTQAQLDAMPPEAAKHASEMSDYAKAQAEMNKGRVAPPKK